MVERMKRHGSASADVCVVQGRSLEVTWAGSGQVKVQKKQANVKDGDYVITPYRSLAERDRPPVYCRGAAKSHGISSAILINAGWAKLIQNHQQESESYFTWDLLLRLLMVWSILRSQRVNSAPPYIRKLHFTCICAKCFVHQENADVFIVHRAIVAEASTVHQGNVVEYFGSYIK